MLIAFGVTCIVFWPVLTFNNSTRPLRQNEDRTLGTNSLDMNEDCRADLFILRSFLYNNAF